MPEIDYDLARFFAWARARAYAEFDRRMQLDPALDPNWAFSDIMQELLGEYRQSQSPPQPQSSAADSDGK